MSDIVIASLTPNEPLIERLPTIVEFNPYAWNPAGIWNWEDKASECKSGSGELSFPWRNIPPVIAVVASSEDST